MAIQLGAKALADFERPLEMLVDCHRRVEHFLDVMIRVLTAFRSRPLDEDGHSALENAMRYFRDAAPKHTADEEVSLFPRMRDAGNLSDGCQQALQQLEADHQWANDVHARIDGRLQRWLSAKEPLAGADADELERDLLALRRHYTSHIRLEEEEVFPVAAKLLRQAHLLEIGREMQARRG